MKKALVSKPQDRAIIPYQSKSKLQKEYQPASLKQIA